MTRARTIWLTVPGSLLVGAVMASCSGDRSAGPENLTTAPVTSVEAKARTAELLADAQNVLGGDWSWGGPTLPDPCGSAVEAERLYYYASGAQENRYDYDEATERIREFWRAQGFGLETAAFSSESRVVIALTPDSAELAYSLRFGHMFLEIDGPCVDGDYGEVQPGDPTDFPEHADDIPDGRPTYAPPRSGEG